MNKPVARTLPVLTYSTPRSFPTVSKNKITCEVTGEMSTGEKVWSDVETGDQYFCVRFYGLYFFIRG